MGFAAFLYFLGALFTIGAALEVSPMPMLSAWFGGGLIFLGVTMHIMVRVGEWERGE